MEDKNKCYSILPYFYKPPVTSHLLKTPGTCYDSVPSCHSSWFSVWSLGWSSTASSPHGGPSKHLACDLKLTVQSSSARWCYCHCGCWAHILDTSGTPLAELTQCCANRVRQEPVCCLPSQGYWSSSWLNDCFIHNINGWMPVQFFKALI